MENIIFTADSFLYCSKDADSYVQHVEILLNMEQKALRVYQKMLI